MRTKTASSGQRATPRGPHARCASGWQGLRRRGHTRDVQPAHQPLRPPEPCSAAVPSFVKTDKMGMFSGTTVSAIGAGNLWRAGLVSARSNAGDPWGSVLARAGEQCTLSPARPRRRSPAISHRTTCSARHHATNTSVRGASQECTIDEEQGGVSVRQPVLMYMEMHHAGGAA
jgi:hypothetical protein